MTYEAGLWGPFPLSSHFSVSGTFSQTDPLSAWKDHAVRHTEMNYVAAPLPEAEEGGRIVKI